jgi:2-dehydropantoate 2-reductase
MAPARGPGPVLVMGAGAIGCYLGGRLQAAGARVVFVGRPRVLDDLRRLGLTLTDLDGDRIELPAASLDLHEQPPADAAPALVLLCVKSGATADAARALEALAPAGTPVLSMQNGISNAEVAHAAAPGLHMLPGMVPFNVAEVAPGCFHRGTTGALAVQDDPALDAWLPVFAAAGLPLKRHADLRPIQWGKLLLNLNNPVNALSGLTLREQLLDPDLRGCTALLIEEALAVLDAAGIKPARVAAVSPHRLPWVLRLPTPIFRLLAARMLRVDEKARSSMADDLARGRTTEIDALCGEVVRLAAAKRTLAPMNARMMSFVNMWPANPRPLTGQQLRARLRGR